MSSQSNLVLVLFSFSLLIIFVSSTLVNNCKTGEQSKANVDELSEQVSILNCTKPPCKLRRKTRQELEIKFKSTENIDKLDNSVSALIAGIPFPFIGVDGKSICSKIYLPDGTKTNCPLEAGKEYLYKDGFDVLELYPKIRTIVHWSLVSNGKDVLCFEIPVKII